MKEKVPTYLKEFYIDSIDYEAENNNQINTDANTEKTKNEILDQNIQKGEVQTKTENGTKKTLQGIFYMINEKTYTKYQILKEEPEEVKKQNQ